MFSHVFSNSDEINEEEIRKFADEMFDEDKNDDDDDDQQRRRR